MRVLYIAPDVPVPHTGKFLGGSTHVLKVAESLARRGCEVFIISRRMTGQTKFEKIADKIVTRRFYRGLLFPLENKSGSWGKKGAILKLTKIIEKAYFTIYQLVLMIYVTWLLLKYHFDIVVERNSAKGIGVFPAWLFRVQSVVEVIDPDFNRVQLSLANKVLTYTRNIIPEIFQNKVVLTHAGVDTNLFKPVRTKDLRERYRLSGKKVVVYIGELSEWHGADTLLDIAEKLEDVSFLMIGKQLEFLKNEAKTRNLAEKFVFVGFVKHEEMPKYISAADLGIAPYKPNEEMKKHGFYFSPIKILEYMACGKPVIASDLDIIRDIIKHCKCGILAKPNDTEDFATKITKLLDNKKLIKKMGMSGRRVVSKYSWDEVVSLIIK